MSLGLFVNCFGRSRGCDRHLLFRFGGFFVTSHQVYMLHGLILTTHCGVKKLQHQACIFQRKGHTLGSLLGRRHIVSGPLLFGVFHGIVQMNRFLLKGASGSGVRFVGLRNVLCRVMRQGNGSFLQRLHTLQRLVHNGLVFTRLGGKFLHRSTLSFHKSF